MKNKADVQICHMMPAAMDTKSFSSEISDLT